MKPKLENEAKHPCWSSTVVHCSSVTVWHCCSYFTMYWNKQRLLSPPPSSLSASPLSRTWSPALSRTPPWWGCCTQSRRHSPSLWSTAPPPPWCRPAPPRSGTAPPRRPQPHRPPRRRSRTGSRTSPPSPSHRQAGRGRSSPGLGRSCTGCCTPGRPAGSLQCWRCFSPPGSPRPSPSHTPGWRAPRRPSPARLPAPLQLAESSCCCCCWCWGVLGRRKMLGRKEHRSSDVLWGVWRGRGRTVWWDCRRRAGGWWLVLPVKTHSNFTLFSQVKAFFAVHSFN